MTESHRSMSSLVRLRSARNAEAAAAAIARLRILLEASDGDSEESFLGLQEAVAGAVEKTHLDGLSASINNFDFDSALVKLDEIAKSLHTKLGGLMNHADQRKTVLLVDDAADNIQIVNQTVPWWTKLSRISYTYRVISFP